MLSFKQFITEAPKGFEGSKFDDDKGVKEGSPADKKRDAKEIPKFLAAKKNEAVEEISEESNSAIAKKAHKGENVGHGGFGKVASAAAKEYGSKKAGEKVAASVMWKKYGHKK